MEIADARLWLVQEVAGYGMRTGTGDTLYASSRLHGETDHMLRASVFGIGDQGFSASCRERRAVLRQGSQACRLHEPTEMLSCMFPSRAECVPCLRICLIKYDINMHRRTPGDINMHMRTPGSARAGTVTSDRN